MVMRINVLLVEDDHALREALADTCCWQVTAFGRSVREKKPWRR